VEQQTRAIIDEVKEQMLEQQTRAIINEEKEQMLEITKKKQC